MPKYIHRIMLSLFVILSFYSVAKITLAEGSPPSLFYSFLSIKHGKDACLKRAHAAVASEVAGKIMKRTDDVALVSDEYNLSVHCRKTSASTSFVTIVVAHRSSFNEAKGLALNIRRGMETGLFE